VSILPSLWDESGDETLRKQTIVTLLVKLFSSMGPESKQYQDFALFIVKAVLAPDSALPQIERMALLPDALDLWRAVLENTPNASIDQLHPDLLNLLKQCLIPTLNLDSEARRAALEITSSYILLIPREFLSESAFVVELLASQASDLRSLKPDASAQVFEVVELLIRAADELAGVDGVKTVGEIMVSSDFFRELMLGLRESYEAHQTTGPRAKVSNVQGEVETDFLVILARIMYASPELFVSMVGPEAPNTVPWLLEEWFSHTQDMISSDPPRQKLMAMALSKLFSLAEPYIILRAQQVLDLWTSVLQSLSNPSDSFIYPQTIDSLVYPKSEEGGTYTATHGQSAGEARKAALQDTDPVNTIVLRELVSHVLGIVIEKFGGPEGFRNEVLGNVDKEVLEQFGALGVL
jgi:hypothetical protein